MDPRNRAFLRLEAAERQSYLFEPDRVRATVSALQALWASEFNVDLDNARRAGDDWLLQEMRDANRRSQPRSPRNPHYAAELDADGED